MNCPSCGHENTCPCPSCQARRPTDRPWVWVDDELISCGACGFTKHCDWWEEQSGK